MEKPIANYRVIIEKDTQTGTKKSGYVAYVPTLGIVDDGYTIEEALDNTRKTIKFHLECLVEEGKYIPEPDSDEYFVTTAKILFDRPALVKKLKAAISQTYGP